MAEDGATDAAARPTLEAVFHELAPSLIAWAAIRLPADSRRHVAPEDVAQEVWLRSVRIWETSFDPKRSSARAWVFAVAKNILLEIRRSTSRTALERPADGSTTRCIALTAAPAAITSLTARLSRDDDIRRFLDRVAELPDDDRRLLLHCGMEGLSLAETAVRLGIGVEAATKRWQRLRGRIAEWGVSRALLVA